MTSPSPSSAPQPAGDVVVHVFGRTDVGRTREHNEDAFVVADLTAENATLQPEVRRHVVGPRGSLFMVADGMGGAAAGEIASAMAVEVVIDELRANWVRGTTGTPEGFARAIKRATAEANARIHAYAVNHPEYRGMGTTATIAGLLGSTLYLAQVGDSRAYLVRDGVIRQITKDQSLMQKLIEAGELTEEEAAQSERRNIILQALGPEAVIKVDLTHQSVRRGDVLVICSDGLSGQVSKDDIAAVVTAEPDLMAACKALIDRANDAGGPDNITVILARFDGEGLSAAGAQDLVGHAVYPLPDTGQTAAVSVDAASQADTPKSVRAVAPGTATEGRRPTTPITPPATEAAAGRAPTRAIAPRAGDSEQKPVVSPSRRSAGRLIAYALLAAALIGAAWYVWHEAKKVAPATSTKGGA